MIAIINIDPNLRKTGEHLYQIKINNSPVITFKHNREEDLATCLKKAYKAVDRMVKKLADNSHST